MNESYFDEDPTKNSNGTGNPRSSEIPISISLQIFWGIYGSILIIFGIPGNLLVICVFQRKLLRGIVSTFLTAVAVLNIIFLTCGVPRVLIMYILQYDIHLATYEVCLLLRWITSFTQSSSNWLLVLVTGARLFYLKSSVRRYRVFTRTKARVMIVLTVIFLMFFEYIMLQMRNIGANKDSATNSRKLLRCKIDVQSTAAWIRHSVVTFSPAFFLFLLTVWLIIEDLSDRGLEPISKNIAEIANVFFTDNFSRMLTLTNVLFLATNLPAPLYFAIAKEPFDSTTKWGMAYNTIVSSLVTALLYMGFTLTVIVYSFSERRFPSEIKDMLIHRHGHKESLCHVTISDPSLFTASKIGFPGSRFLLTFPDSRPQERSSSSTEV